MKLTKSEKARLDFYRGVIAMIRHMDGLVLVATADGEDMPGAVLCWLPRNAEPSPWNAFTSGFAWALVRFGLTGIRRFLYCHHMAGKVWEDNLSPSECKSLKRDGAYAFILATDPSQSGKGLAQKLLGWQVERHKAEFPQRPIFIETAQDRTAKLYERVGFREVGRQTLEKLERDRATMLPQNRDAEFVQISLMIAPDGK